MARGVFKSCAAEARALVVRWKRSCNSAYSCTRLSEPGRSTSGLVAETMPASWPGLPARASETHVFLCVVVIRESDVRRGEEIRTQLSGRTPIQNRKARGFCCQRKMHGNYPSVAKLCTFNSFDPGRSILGW